MAERIEKNGKIFYKYKGKLYPEYLNRGNAISFILETAKKYCKGKGLDIGAGGYPFPGSIPIENESHQNAYTLDNFEDASLDYIISSHYLEHLDKWQDALRLWISKLKPGGILFLYLPHESMELWHPGAPWVGSEHKWIPTLTVVSDFLTENGMTIIDYNPDKDDYWSFYIVARKTSNTKTNENISLILIIREVALGDVLLITPFLPALKAKYPKAQIHLKTAAKEVLINNPYVDKIIHYNEAINLKDYQLIFDLNLSYEKEPLNHIIDTYQKYLKVKPLSQTPEIYLSPKDETFGDEIYRKLYPYIVFDIGETWPSRTWPITHYQELAKLLKKEGFNIVELGITTKNTGEAYNLTNRTTVQQAASVISKCTVFIGPDSLLAHIAQALNKPSFIFFGPILPETRIVRNKPFVKPLLNKKLQCLGCHQHLPPPRTFSTCARNDNYCMISLTPELAFDEVMDFLKAHKKLISLIIPTYNTTSLLSKCLKSLRENMSLPFLWESEIIIVDDGSSSDIQKDLQKIIENERRNIKASIRLILRKSNGGFSSTVNEGIRHSKGKYVVLINNDIEFCEKNWLKNLIMCADSHPNVGIVGAKLLYPETKLIQHAGHYFLKEINIFDHKYRGKPNDYPPANIEKEVVSVTGALVLIKREVINKIGLFDENYFVAYEDTDYCLRARERGFAVMYCPSCEAFHHEGKTRGSSLKPEYIKPEYMERENESREYFWKKWKRKISANPDLLYKNILLEFATTQKRKTSKRILVFRNGGFGDILLTTPALRGLKEKYPESEITYLCYKECAFLLKNNPFIDQVLTTENFWPPYPEFFELAPNYDLFFNLYLAVENDYYLKKWDRIEAFCDVTGVKPSSFELTLNLEKGKDKRDERLIAIHTEGTAAERCWPYEYYTELIEILINDGFKVLLLGKEPLKEKINKDSRIIDKCGKLTFQESLYELSGCAALIGPDSAFYHCAAALDIPFVVIFGPISPELRTKHYKGKKFKALRKSSCPPCHHYPRCGINPTNQEQKGKSQCMAAVTPKIVKEALYELLS